MAYDFRVIWMKFIEMIVYFTCIRINGWIVGIDGAILIVMQIFMNRSTGFLSQLIQHSIGALTVVSRNALSPPEKRGKSWKNGLVNIMAILSLSIVMFPSTYLQYIDLFLIMIQAVCASRTMLQGIAI